MSGTQHSSTPMTAKTVVFCWSDISGYMAACWRELARRGNVRVHVLAFAPTGDARQAWFSSDTMAGVSGRLLNDAERQDVDAMECEVLALKPDHVVFPGWMHPPHRVLVRRLHKRGIRTICTIDTPWWGRPRQHLARLMLRRYLAKFSRVFVPGERAWQYAWRLGIPPAAICRGLYGVDVSGLAPLHALRAESEWPRRFLFVGRYAPEKGMDVLAEAYRRYRASVAQPWELDCCGRGPEQARIAGQPGIVDLGFQQPEQLKEHWRTAGAFVLPSRFDPWPLVLVEAAAAGLPLIASDACGSAVEVLRPCYNGWTFPTGDAESLAQALRRCHERHSGLHEMGRRSQMLAAPYSAESWAERWEEQLLERQAT